MRTKQIKTFQEFSGTNYLNDCSSIKIKKTVMLGNEKIVYNGDVIRLYDLKLKNKPATKKFRKFLREQVLPSRDNKEQTNPSL